MIEATRENIVVTISMNRRVQWLIAQALRDKTMQIINWQDLSRISGNLKTPAIVSSLLVLPFIALELINRRSLPQGFPIVLFLIMWLLPLSFILILMPILRKQRSEKPSMKNLLSLLPRVGLLIFIAWFWVGLVLDQMPCFLGVPNCD